MGPLEIIVIVAAVLIVAGVVGYSIYKKVSGKPTDCGCGCSCSGCQGCSHATKAAKDKKDSNE